MASLSTLCVYCGSSNRARPAFLDAAERLGNILAANDVGLVYGGGRLGLMGRVADGVLAGQGRVTGIIPEHLHRVEVRHEGVTELLIVNTMHERKAEMFRRSDGFCVLPGGIGTLDEVVEILTWRQLGLHDDPIVIVNQEGYFDPFREMLTHIVAEHFAGQETLDFLTWVDTVEDVLPAIAALPESRLAQHPEKV